MFMADHLKLSIPRNHLAVDDFYQLPPVRGLPFYKQRESNLIDFWNSHFSILTLTDVMRQKDDSYFANMLNRLRTQDSCTWAAIC